MSKSVNILVAAWLCSTLALTLLLIACDNSQLNHSDIDGKYIVTLYQEDGELDVLGMKEAIKSVVIKNRVVTIDAGITINNWSISLDTTKNPHYINAVLQGGPHKDKLLPGVYKIEKTKVVIVIATNGVRPTNFDPLVGRTLMELARSPVNNR